MEESTAAAVETALAAVQEEWRELAAWVVGQRAADLPTLEAGLRERGHRVRRARLGAALAGVASDLRQGG